MVRRTCVTSSNQCSLRIASAKREEAGKTSPPLLLEIKQKQTLRQPTLLPPINGFFRTELKMFSIDNLSCLSFYDQGLLEERMDFFFIQIGTKAMVRNEFYIRLQPISLSPFVYVVLFMTIHSEVNRIPIDG